MNVHRCDVTFGGCSQFVSSGDHEYDFHRTERVFGVRHKVDVT
jgi:hypothetical protein